MKSVTINKFKFDVTFPQKNKQSTGFNPYKSILRLLLSGKQKVHRTLKSLAGNFDDILSWLNMKPKYTSTSKDVDGSCSQENKSKASLRKHLCRRLLLSEKQEFDAFLDRTISFRRFLLPKNKISTDT